MVGFTNVEIATKTGASILNLNSTSIQASQPIVGDSSTSPYGVHGDVTTAFTATGSVTAAQYAQGLFVLSPLGAGITLSGFPRAAAGAGYSKAFEVTTAFANVISDGTHSVTLPAVAGLYIVWFTNGALYYK